MRYETENEYLKSLPGYSILDSANVLAKLDLIDFADVAGLLHNPAYLKLIWIIELNYAIECLRIPLLKTEVKRNTLIAHLAAMKSVIESLKSDPSEFRRRIKEAYYIDPLREEKEEETERDPDNG